jgi:hypothetical protein
MKQDGHKEQVELRIEVGRDEDTKLRAERIQCELRNFLMRHFHGGWKTLPPRSPELTPLDFYFWEYMKKITCSVRVHDMQHLKQRIREAAASITAVLGRVWQEMEFRLEVCRTNGAHLKIR